MVDLVFGMHSHWDGLQKTSVGRLRRWYSFSNWVLRRAAKVPSSRNAWGESPLKGGAVISYCNTHLYHLHPQLHHRSIPEISPRLLQFQWWRRFKKIKWGEVSMINSHNRAARFNFLNGTRMRIILNKRCRVGMGATRPVAILIFILSNKRSIRPLNWLCRTFFRKRKSHWIFTKGSLWLVYHLFFRLLLWYKNIRDLKFLCLVN